MSNSWYKVSMLSYWIKKSEEQNNGVGFKQISYPTPSKYKNRFPITESGIIINLFNYEKEFYIIAGRIRYVPTIKSRKSAGRYTSATPTVIIEKL